MAQVLQCGAVCYSALQCVATRCNVLQRVAVCHSHTECLRLLLLGLLHGAGVCGVSKHIKCVAVCCSMLQCVAACCSVLQCVAVCCSALQCVAVNTLSVHIQGGEDS